MGSPKKNEGDFPFQLEVIFFSFHVNEVQGLTEQKYIYLVLLCRNDSDDSNVRSSGFFKKQSFF